MASSLIKLTKSFFVETSGSVAIIAAIVLPVAIFAIGSAVDYSNFLAARQITSAALDSAALAAARRLENENITLAEAEADARQFLRLNLQNNPAIDIEAVVGDLTVTRDPNTNNVVTRTNLTVVTHFAVIFGFNTLDAAMVAEAETEADLLEFAFVLDMSGSMTSRVRRGSRITRIQVLREAMIDSVNTLLPSDGSNDDLVRVSLIPYSDAVNLGDFFLPAVGRGTDSGRNASNHRCVTEREGSRAFEDVAPNDSDTTTLYETDSFLFDGIDEDGNLVRDGRGRPVRLRGSDACTLSTIRPLTNNRADLLDDIRNFNASGFTAGHIGIEWGFNALSEKYQSFWPEGAAPADYDSRDSRKILIIMTDGDFNTNYQDERKGNNRNSARNRQTQSQDAARSFCFNAVDEQRNVEVYTIAFGNQRDIGNTANVLSFCASPDTAPGDQHVFLATSRIELQQAFEDIVAGELRLRITR